MPFDSPFSVFGFYIKTKKGYWYSDSALNNPMKGPRDQDHMVAYAGKDGELKLGDGAALEWDSDCLLLGWEDLNLRRSDRDYNDWVLMFDRTNSFHPVPDHTGTLFWLGGLLAVLMVAERLFPFQTSPLRR